MFSYDFLYRYTIYRKKSRYILCETFTADMDILVGITASVGTAGCVFCTLLGNGTIIQSCRRWQGVQDQYNGSLSVEHGRL